MSMEGDGSTYAPPPVYTAPPIYAASPVVAPAASALKFSGGPTGLTINPMYSGGTTGTGGREGDVITTPTVLDSYYAYDPVTKQQHMWDTSGKYLGVYKNDAFGGLKDFVKGFVLPAVGMYTGVNALGGLFGAGGALGGVSGATQAAAQQATAADIAGGMVPEFASNSAYDAAVGAAGMAPETLPSIFADTTAPLTPATDVMLPPSQSASMAAGNEAVASGMSPGSVGAAQAAAATLTPAELAAAYGTTGAFPSLPSAPSATESSFPSLTEGQFASILKALPGLLGGALGASVMPSASSATRLPAYQPASTMPQYSPEYFQQIQQRYNQIMPSRPADVATPLSQWYNKPADSSVVTKLFGVI